VDAGIALSALASVLPGLRISGALGHPSLVTAGSAAARWAVECALLDLEARLAGVPFYRRLAEHTGLPADTHGVSVGVNAALGSLMELRPDHLAAAARAGFQVLKLKVGMAAPEHELARLRRLCAHLPPGVSLRLDANGAWDDSTALEVIQGLAGMPIESLEEPLAIPDPAILERLQAAAHFPIALDESLPRSIEALTRTGLPVRRAVLKPATVGGPRRGLALARSLRDLGAEVIVTGILDAAPGLWATAHFAALLGAGPPDEPPVEPAARLTHGLATADWLARDLGAGPKIEDGRIQLPSVPGTGFRPFDSTCGAP
jgi:L-alanine-DL-glutamate epimerase-like enolase superfamily enzyme